MSKPFGFTVGPEPVRRYERGQMFVVGPGWRVFLPHQCDDWDVAGEEHDGIPHAEAVAALERFIAEAQVALAKLRKAPA